MNNNSATSTPVINREELITRMMGSVQMAERMLHRFVETADSDCDFIESTVRIGNKEAIAAIAHRHKGTAKTMATPRVAELAAELEARAYTDSSAELLQLVHQMRVLHQEVRDVVQRGLTQSSAERGSPDHAC